LSTCASQAPVTQLDIDLHEEDRAFVQLTYDKARKALVNVCSLH